MFSYKLYFNIAIIFEIGLKLSKTTYTDPN